MLLKQLRHREYRTDPHLVGFAARNRDAAVRAERFEPALLRHLAVHEDTHRGAVGELARVAGRDGAALEDRLDPFQVLVGGAGAVALVLPEGQLLVADLSRLLVDEHLGRAHRDHLGVVAPFGLRLRGARLALHPVVVHLLALDPVALRDRLRRLQHRHVGVLGVVEDPGILHPEGVLVLVLHEAHRFQAARDHHLHAFVQNLVGRDADRHHPRRALSVDGHARHLHRHARGERGAAPDVVPGGALRERAAEDHVLHLSRLDLGAGERMGDGVRGHRRPFGVVERTPVGLADGGSRGRYDDGLLHVGLLGIAFERRAY